MSLVESLQQDYALAAIEHIEGLSHRVQRQLQKALGGTTLTQFAHCCASRILINEGCMGSSPDPAKSVL